MNTSKPNQISKFHSHSMKCNVIFILSLFILLLETDFYKPAFQITFSKFYNLDSVNVNQKLILSNIT